MRTRTDISLPSSASSRVIIQGGLIGRLVKMFGEVTLARVGMLLTAASLALLPLSDNLTVLLLVCAGLSFGSGLASPPLSGLASQMIDRSWQGRALGVMQSAGSAGRLLGPLLGGWLLMFDLRKPIAEYGRTPFLVGAPSLFHRRSSGVLSEEGRQRTAPSKMSPPSRVSNV